MKSRMTRQGSISVAKTFMVIGAALVAGQASAANFEGAEVPILVRTAVCNSYPRIIVQFADPSKNIWYPADAGDTSKQFLATALAAKIAGQKMYFLGVDEPATYYCIATARYAHIFGISD